MTGRAVGAVVLAAGYGSRLRDFLPGLPKPLVAVEGTPVLVRLVGALLEAGISPVHVVWGPVDAESERPGHPIRDVLDTPEWRDQGVVLVEGQSRGTGIDGYLGLRDMPCDDVIVTVSDIFVRLPIDQMISTYAVRGGAATVATSQRQDVDRRSRYGSSHDGLVVVREVDGRTERLPGGLPARWGYGLGVAVVNRRFALRAARCPEGQGFGGLVYADAFRAGLLNSFGLGQEYLLQLDSPQNIQRLDAERRLIRATLAPG